MTITQAITKNILRLAWPAIATNITTPLLALIDIVIVGHIDGGSLIGAVAVGSTLQNALYWLFAFLRMGTSGITAQAYGAKDYKAQKQILKRSASVALFSGVFLMGLTPLLGADVVLLVDPSQHFPDSPALLYFQLVMLGAPAMLLTYVVSGWLLGMQRSKIIMYIAVGTNLLNILLSTFFVFVFDMGLKGVALGTVLSQYVSAIVGLFQCRACLKRKRNQGEIQEEDDDVCKTKKSSISWVRIFSVNKDIFLRTLCLSAVTIWFTRAGAHIGPDILAANALMMQFFMIFSYFTDGFAFAGEALAGRYYGAGEYDNLRRTINTLLRIGLVLSLVFTALYVIAGDIFMNLLTNDTSIIEVVKDYRIWILLIPLSGFGAFTWDGIFVGLTKTGLMLITVACSMAVFFGVYFLGMYLVGKENIASCGIALNNHVLWIAFLCWLIVRSVLSHFLYKRLEF